LLACIVQGWCAKYVFPVMKYTYWQAFFRCTAPANNLDAHQHVHRSQAHTELLVEVFELGTLWDVYGLVGDIVVSVLPLCLSKSNIIFKPFTSTFPWADIHELLTPDLLYQLIKGAFKDHLVTWVNDYITAEYPASEAQKILDDIDWW
jgi:hypothetical protein